MASSSPSGARGRFTLSAFDRTDHGGLMNRMGKNRKTTIRWRETPFVEEWLLSSDMRP